jgi:hypothetical protein
MAKMLVRCRQYDHKYAMAYWKDDDDYTIATWKRKNKKAAKRVFKHIYRVRETRKWRADQSDNTA